VTVFASSKFVRRDSTGTRQHAIASACKMSSVPRISIGIAICVHVSAFLSCALMGIISTGTHASVSVHHKNARQDFIGTANSASVGVNKMWIVRLDIIGMKTSANVCASLKYVQVASTGIKTFASASVSLNNAHQTYSGAKRNADVSVCLSAA